MKTMIRCAALLAATLTVSAQEDGIVRVRAWRAQHEPQILRELFELVAIPNVATDQADIARNAQALTRMFEKRRFLPETIPTGGAPLVVAERRVPGARRTVAFYFHYDGQPVEARDWTHGPPFTPVIVTDLTPAGRTLKLDELRGAIDPQWRAFGRSSSDDKGPIVAFLAAIDALDASNIPLTSNIRVLMEGEEEAGSPNLEAAVRAHADRIRADALILVDGPRHASDRPTLNFGSRGLMGGDHHGLRRLARSAQRQLRQLGAQSRARPRPAARVDEAGRRPRHRRRLLRRCRAVDGGGAPGDRRHSECRGDADAGLRLHAPRERVRSGSSCATTSRPSTSTRSRPAAASGDRGGRSFPARRARRSTCAW